MRRLLTRKSYLDLEFKYSNSINEAPFVNDLPWGDTHVGRLINSFARKTKISFNKRRISGLVDRLKSVFDEMLAVGSVDIKDNTLAFIKISSLLGELTKQVNDGEDVNILISTTEDLISEVTGYEYDNKEVMLKALNEFLSYLKSLKNTTSKDDSDKDKEVSANSDELNTIKYSKSFLQSIVNINTQIKENLVRFSGSEHGVNVNFKTHFNINKFKEIKSKYEKSSPENKLGILKQLVQMCENGLDSYKSSKDKSNIDLFTQYLNKYSGILSGMMRDKNSKSDKPNDNSNVKDDKIDKEKATISTGAKSKVLEANDNGGPSNIEGNESDAKNAWIKVVKAYNQSGVSNYISKIESILSVKTGGDKENFKSNNKDIVNICKQVISNKTTIGKPIDFESLIKESNNFSDVSKSISLFGRVLLAFKDDIGILDAYGSTGGYIKTFISSYGELEKLINVKNESLLRYDRFISINEKNEFTNEIKEKFDNIFTPEVSEHFNISDTKKGDLEKEITKRNGDLVFTNADPIIEIVRLFNRSWRIHTPGVIPSGRTGGRVSNSVFREYEDLGGGNGTQDSPGAGPYRNIELYEQWFEAVQDILSDTKYRPIFSDKAVFKFKNEETGGVGDDIKKGGKILLRFINELLSDSKMYKSGAMQKFITEYFKLDSSKVLKDMTYDGYKGDAKKNDNTSSGVKIKEVSYKKIDEIKDFNEYSGDLFKVFLESKYKNLAFKIEVKGEEEDSSQEYYCVFKYVENGYPIFMFSPLNYAYDLSKVDGINKFNIARKSFLATLNKSGTLKVGQTSKVRYIEVSKDPMTQSDINYGKNVDRDSFFINNIEILCEKDTSNPYLDFTKYLPSMKNNISKNSKVAKSYIKSK